MVDGRPTGAVRISIGAYTSVEDIDRFAQFLKKYFIGKDSIKAVPKSNAAAPRGITLSSMIIYPIKSCSGWSIPAGVDWAVTSKGLAWDREWMLVSQQSGLALSQKRYPQMSLVHPRIDLSEGVLVISAPNVDELRIPLDITPMTRQENRCEGSARVCSENVTTLEYSDASMDAWFSAAVNVPCRLVRSASDRHGSVEKLVKGAPPSPPSTPDRSFDLGLTNESPFLFISSSSVRDIVGRVAGPPLDEDGSCFRANFVVDGTDVWTEDTWDTVQIGLVSFKMLGKCRRCHMVCIDQKTGARREEPYATLAIHRRIEGNLYFGQHAMSDVKPGQVGSTLRVGEKVKVLRHLPIDPEDENIV